MKRTFIPITRSMAGRTLVREWRLGRFADSFDANGVMIGVVYECADDGLGSSHPGVRWPDGRVEIRKHSEEVLGDVASDS